MRKLKKITIDRGWLHRPPKIFYYTSGKLIIVATHPENPHYAVYKESSSKNPISYESSSPFVVLSHNFGDVHKDVRKYIEDTIDNFPMHLLDFMEGE